MKNEELLEALEERIDRAEKNAVKNTRQALKEIRTLEKIARAGLLVSCAVLSFLIGIFIRGLLS